MATDATDGLLQMMEPDFDDVCRAAQRLQGQAHHTPILTSRTVNERVSAEVLFKAEHLQRIGAFKFRGAWNAIARLDEQQRRRGVLAYSSGNHAQAVALAAREQQTTATIVMPEDAPPAKLAATRAYGARVVLYDRYNEDREAIASDLAEREALSLIPPYDHPDVIAGQGTAAMELFKEAGEIDTLLVCLGGGGLLAGSALVARQLSPHCRLIGVEPEAGNDGQQSLARGEIVTIPAPRTLADGAATTHLGHLTFPIIRREVSDILTVSDTALTRTMRFFAERMKQFVEPTGCLAAAALLEGLIDVSNQRVGVLISGGNIDPDRYARLLTEQA
ncbi:serine dehydratase [Kushneria phosphatilytica]|uniref:Threo-3-hydroxy-L-aspartate ammonia-lyase n=2 Tax=Kushneria phosphatilytica TaxID=657387 RepID=A0A1S1NZG0_9GAMM|nr:serine dehydratase [Kushneria phosphatilytica]QEL12765.1 threo-3-hydroxy-L-aspartate ammonia-lyase [Kushneria phosphatilytica]